MKLAEAIDIGKECGLETIEESILNIELHSVSLFLYDKIREELNELYQELKEQYPDIYNKLFKKVENNGIN